MYKHEEVEARVGQMSPILRELAEEMLQRSELYAKTNMPLEENLDSDLMAQLRLVLSDPALNQEWQEFWQALGDAYREDEDAILRGEHDHEL
jgi:hypothetical protein